jgi:ribosome biogenesis GTPase / thiamine phosphate phosphatase
MDNMKFNDSFDRQKQKLLVEGFSIVRVTEENKNRYKVRIEDKEIVAEASGKLMFGADENGALPAVGDWVGVSITDNGEFAVIQEVLPRKTLFERKSTGKRTEGQIIAANIDVIFIVTSLDLDYSLNRIERYHVISLSSGAKPVFLLSKSDLITGEELQEKKDEVKKITSSEVITYSLETGEGLEDIRSFLKEGITFCFVGSSGVGKSTLINELAGEDILESNEVRESDSKGRHTTTRRQLIFLENGSTLIDTPGMREVGLWSEANDIEGVFDEIVSFSSSCKFPDCTHTHEPDCAVIKAVEEGNIDERRYNNYLSLREEARLTEEKNDPNKQMEKKRKAKILGKAKKDFNKNWKKK